MVCFLLEEIVIFGRANPSKIAALSLIEFPPVRLNFDCYHRCLNLQSNVQRAIDEAGRWRWLKPIFRSAAPLKTSRALTMITIPPMGYWRLGFHHHLQFLSPDVGYAPITRSIYRVLLDKARSGYDRLSCIPPATGLQYAHGNAFQA